MDGTFAFGTYSNSLIASSEFSVPFSQYVTPRLRVLFITGDQKHWLVARYEQIASVTSGAGSRYRPIASSAPVYNSDGRINLELGFLPFFKFIRIFGLDIFI